MKTKSKYQAAFMQQVVKAGGRRVSVVLTPAASASLDKLALKHGGIAKAINAVLTSPL